MRGQPFSICVFAVFMPCALATLTACTSHPTPQPVMAEQCSPISGSQPVSVSVANTASATAGAVAGTPLRILIRQRGISVIATLSSSVGSATQSTKSPVDRLGVMTFVADSHANASLTLKIRAHDSPDITGEVCISADRLDPRDAGQLRAERAFAAAGQAVQADNAQRAFDLYLAAARDFTRINTTRAAQSRHALAEIAYGNLREDDNAYVLATWALADFGTAADPGLRSALVALQARSLLESERFSADILRARVLELLRTAQALAEQARYGERELPRFDILRGFMEFQADNVPGATALFMRAAERCEKLHDWECNARARQNVAILAEEQRNYTVALQAYGDALRVLPEDLDPKLSADIWSNYGRLQGTAGLFKPSEQSHRNSIRLHAAVEDCDGTRMSLARLGTLLVQVGSIGEGHTYLTRAASLDCRELLSRAKRESASTPRADSSAQEFASEDSNDLADTPADTACLSAPAADTLSADGKLAVFNALLGLRDASKLSNNDVESARCLDAARPYAFTPRMQLRLANAEGAALLDHGKAGAAREAFQRGVTVADQAALPPTHENRSLAYLGLARSALLENRPMVARDYANRSLALGSARADVGQIVDSLQLMASSYGKSSERATAESILRTAAGLIEQVPIDDLDAEKRATWLASQHTVFADLASLFATDSPANPADVWEAFDISERGRARSLRYAANQATDVRAINSETGASDRYHELMRQISQLASGSPSAPTAAISGEALRAVGGEPEIASDPSAHADLQHRLAALDATVVEYAVAHEDMFAFVIDSESIRVTKLASRIAIATAAADLYERLRNPETAPSDVRRAAQRLAQLALWPITPYVTRPRVIFVPDDSLHTIPFAVLPWSAAEGAPLLLERAEISVMPSTLFVNHTRNKPAPRESAPRFELIGDPVFRTSDWERECAGHGLETASAQGGVDRSVTRSVTSTLPRLPGSRAEVLAIEQLAHRALPASRVHAQLGCDATPTGLRAAAESSPELLHIATHGYVDAYRPRLSALLLTPDATSRGGPGKFGLLDILNMKIASRLVVLSACDTSRGRLLPGEGVLGPAQAFLQAGAASVVASYWRIADDATAPFMQVFYKYLLVEHLAAAAALRQTQLDFAHAGTSRDWAAFTLYGWPDTTL